ncbi:hypothetical protein [Salinimicrobium flavum]|uniref:Cytochrome b561 domain-containing protein n=1 Tax=Salinimicrobium flavum TaxID=1737065 RepID=A0ABW5IVZ6_9FLAO
MLITAVVLICIAVFLGAYLLSYVLKQKIPPKAIVFAHGGAAVIGLLVLLTYALTTARHHKHWDSIIVFSIAAIAGLYLFSRDIRHKNVPRWLAVVHGGVGLGGFTWLLIHVLN